MALDPEASMSLRSTSSISACHMPADVPRLCHVRERRQDGPDVWTLEIALADDGPFHFAPGQFNMLTAFGVGEAAISISGPSGRGALIHTIRDVGPVSHALSHLAPGDPIGLRGPFGMGWPMTSAEGADVVIVAGGLGLAPLRPVIYDILSHRHGFGAVTLLYGARRPEDILYRSEIDMWRLESDVEVKITVDHADMNWRGHVGIVTGHLARVRIDPSRTIAMICGPEVMMRFVAAALTERDLSARRIFLSMERNMKCAIGHCGHCQLGPALICRDGPVFTYERMRPLMSIKEL
jgi:NAD(P)H-flavin reductase